MSSARNSATESIQTLSSNHRATPVTDETLDPGAGALRNRLCEGDHWPMQSKKIDARCQLRFWATGRKSISQLLACSY